MERKNFNVEATLTKDYKRLTWIEIKLPAYNMLMGGEVPNMLRLILDGGYSSSKIMSKLCRKSIDKK